VVRGSLGYFTESNVLNDPRVNLDVEDIAHFLLRGDSEYELIISDGKLAEGFSGNELMLCSDFYEQAKQRLTADGIFIQWLPLAYPTDAFKIVLRTFLASFPETELFLDFDTGLYMIGSRRPIGRVRAEQLDRELAHEDLAALDIPNMSALMSRWVASGPELRRVVGEGRISTWDHSATEFAINRSDAPSLSASKSANLSLLLEARALSRSHPYLSPESPFVRSGNLVHLSRLAIFRGDFDEAIRLANQAARINPKDPVPRAILRWLMLFPAGNQ